MPVPPVYGSLYVRYPAHPKIARLSDAAFRVHVSAILYCHDYLTDGLVPKPVVLSYGRKGTRELLAAGLLEDRGTDYLIHDYLDWNESRADVEEKRSKKAAAGRASAQAKAAASVPTPVVAPVQLTQDPRPKGSEASSTKNLPHAGNGSSLKERTALKDALVVLCGWDPKVLTKLTWGRVEAAAKEAHEGGYDAEDLEIARDWFARQYPTADVTPQAIIGAIPSAAKAYGTNR